MTKKHSDIGASGMHRWAPCPGSVRLSKGVPKTTSVYAKEGTLAHSVAEYYLRRGGSPTVALRKFGSVDLPSDMVEAINVYIDHVRESAMLTDVVKYEQKFDLSKVHPGLFGTADCVLWRPSEKLLIVMDYKHGAGIPVEVKDNKQLMYYALGALLQSGYPAAKVRMEIVQPRCDHPDGPIRSYEIDSLELLDFSADLKVYAEATEKKDAALVPGEHCRFCPAADLNPETVDVYCPARRAQRREVAKVEFSPALSYDPEKLRTALDSLDSLREWIKAVDEFAYAEAEAGRFTGHGYKLVDKYPRSKWISEPAVIDFLQKKKMADEWAFEPRSVRSPAQIRDGIMELKDFEPEIKVKHKRKAAAKAFIADLFVDKSSGHALVPDSDKRPPIKLSAKDDFNELALPKFLDRHDEKA